ncbi:MAG: DUF4157 domain-containing protein [Sphingobacteriaceae bacterium]
MKQQHHIKKDSENSASSEPTKQLKSNAKSLAPPDSGINFTIQKKENKTGLPDNVKSGVEQLSGVDISDVKVHYNSSQPAQLNAHAYAQGNQIHVAPGQEKHVAHEAWHVVQQKQGRVKPTKQLKGKVGVNDDKGLEKEADVMGAKALQLKMIEGGNHKKIMPSGRTAIQLLAGDAKSAKVLPRFGGHGQSVQDELTERDKEGGRPGQGYKVKRDANLNNTLKVQFENELAMMIMAHIDYAAPVIEHLTKSIKRYIDTKVKHKITSEEEELRKLIPTPDKFGTIFGRITDKLEANYTQYLDQILSEGGDLFSQIQLQATFISEIYDKDFVDITINKSLLPIVQNVNPKTYKSDEHLSLSDNTNIPYSQSHDDSRFKPGEKESAYGKKGRDGDVPLTDKYLGISPLKSEASASEAQSSKPPLDAPAYYQRGTDYWTANEEAAFIQDARLNLDMPLTGTGASGTTAELLTCAKLMGVGGKHLEAYFIGILGYFVSSGAHSFHEVISVAKNAGINYIPGDYFTSLDELFRGTPLHEDYDKLRKKFELLTSQKGVHLGRIPDSALRSPEFNSLDHVETWDQKILEFLASRFTGPVSDLAKLSGGRSPDPVYRVIIGGHPRVFKIFPDIREAETEIQMLLKLREKGVSAVHPIPTKHREIVFPVGIGTSQKAGILMNMEAGVSVDKLVEKMSDRDNDEVNIPALERGVVQTAISLAKLHLETTSKDSMQKAQKQYDTSYYSKKLTMLNGKFTPGRFDFFLGVMKGLGEAYEETNIPASASHGDANAGNFIISPEFEKSTIIDVATMGLSLTRNKEGMKTGAADVGRFLQSLRTSHPGNISLELFNHLKRIFWQIYLQNNTKLKVKEQKDFYTAALFHRFTLEIVFMISHEAVLKSDLNLGNKCFLRVLDIKEEAKENGVKF